MSRDPIEETGGVNLLAGFANSPLTRLDPLGTTLDQVKQICQETIDRHAGEKPPPDEDLTGCDEAVKQLKEGELTKFWGQFGGDCPAPKVKCACCVPHRGGTYSRETTTITVCWNNRKEPRFNLHRILEHEAYHALQQCYLPRPWQSEPGYYSCRSNLMRELEAYACAGDKYKNRDCYGFYDCMKKAARSSCKRLEKHPDYFCTPDRITPQLYAELEAWFLTRDANNELCKFPREPDYPKFF